MRSAMDIFGGTGCCGRATHIFPFVKFVITFQILLKYPTPASSGSIPFCDAFVSAIFDDDDHVMQDII
jgi:hypothetical protein